MPRVKRGVTARKKHKKVLKRTAGHWGARHRLIKTARESMMHALLYSYRDRRNRKRDFRRLWIVRINAACRMRGMRYSQLVAGLQRAQVILDRKTLADIAIHDPEAFTKIADLARQHL